MPDVHKQPEDLSRTRSQSTGPRHTPPWMRGPWAPIHKWGQRNQKLYYITPPSIWAVMLYAGSLISFDPVETEESSSWVIEWMQAIPHFDKLLHSGGYGLLALLVVRGAQREKMPPLSLHLIVLAMITALGVMIEFQQLLTPHRSFELSDMVANSLGAAGGLVIWHLMMLRWGKRTKLYPGLLRPDFKDSPANPANRKKRRTKTENG